MQCPECKNELPEKAKFCLECGASVSGVSAVSGMEAGEVSVGPLRTMMGAAKPADNGGDELDGMRTMQGGSQASDDAAGDRSLGDYKTMQGAGDGKRSTADSAGTPLSDRYELGEELGRGGFARVWKAVDRKLGRTVAVKRLLADQLHGASGEQTISRFRREAQAIAQLNHINIAGVYDHDRDDEGDYIVMECVEGGTLRDYLKAKGGKLPLEDALELARGIARGLAYAHRKNLVHRDIKPANVLLYRDGENIVPKIVDFGLARMGSDSELSMSGFGMGTPWYMPPEQRRNAKGVNHTADIYAVGKVLYELVSGDVPDNVDPDMVPEKWLVPVIMKCIKTNPEERYFSCEDLIKDLDHVTVQETTVEPTTTGEGVCPSCGARNGEDVKYCGKCGTGLVRACPECGKENSIYRTFCAGCGTDVDGFLKWQEALPVIERHREEKRWSRVEKEYGLLPQKPRMPGENGKTLILRVEGMHKEAERAISRMATMDSDIKRMLGNEVISKGFADPPPDLDRLSELLSEYIKINPHSETHRDLLAETLVNIDARDWAVASQSGGAANASGDYRSAIDAYAGYLDRHMEGEYAEAAREALTAAKNARVGVLRVQIKEHLDACRLDAAETAVREGLDVRPNDAGFRQSEGEIKTRREQADKLRSETNVLIANRKYARALRCLDAADNLAGCPENDGLRRQAEEGFRRVKGLRILIGSAVGVVVVVLLLSSGYFNHMRRQTEVKDQLRRQTEVKEQRGPTAGNVVGMVFMEVNAGSFQMGTNDGRDNEKPVRTVRISRDFWMGKYEVTQRQYQQLIGSNPSRFNGDDLPVERVAWDDAVNFCEELTKRERAANRLPQGYVYRLPTEAEWEYAARGGANGRNTQYAGSDNLDTVAWHSGNSGRKTQRVGTKAANELGLHDMSGNVWEWVHDWYQDSYSGLGTTDPTGPADGSIRASRGGCWHSTAAYCLSANRYRNNPNQVRNINLGFRVVFAAPVSSSAQ